MTEAGDAVKEPSPGRCEICAARPMFAGETRCYRHPIITRVVIRLADGQRMEIPARPPEPEAAA